MTMADGSDDGVKLYLDGILRILPYNYTLAQPTLIFNTGPVPPQEPHTDAVQRQSRMMPNLSIIVNLMSVPQHLHVAPTSHMDGNYPLYFNRVSIPPK